MYGERKFRNVLDLSLTPSQRERVTDTWQITNEVEAVDISTLINRRNRKVFSQMSAARAKKPVYRAFRQPYIGLDMYLLQDVYANSPAGRVVDFITYLMSGGGYKPKLKLRNESKINDVQKMKDDLEKTEEKYKVVSRLTDIDNSIGNPGRNRTTYEHTFQEKMDGMLKTALVYGKSMQVRIPSESTYDLYNIHPRDMVWNIVDDTWKLQAVMTTLSEVPYTMDQVIYSEWNPESPIHNVMYHGFSFMQRMLDSARALRRIKGTDMQLIAKKRWMGTGIIAMQRREGEADSKRLLAKLDSGEWYASEEDDPEKAYHVHEIPLPRGAEQVTDMATWLTHDIIAMGGIPTTLFYDESSANHAVFEVRMQAFQKQVEEEYRSWAGAILGKQWYMRNFYDLFPDEEELYENYEVVCEFKPIDFSSLEAKAKAVEMINRITPLKIDAIGEQLKIDNFEDKVDEEKQKQQQEMEKQKMMAPQIPQGNKPKTPSGSGGK